MRATLIRRAAWAGVVFVGAWLACSAALAVERPASASDSKHKAVAPASGVKAPGTADAKRKKLVDAFMKQLGQLRPVGSSKKELDDYWLVGTADLNPATGAANVQFLVKQGQQATAEFLADYMLGATGNTVRKCNVFSRLKDTQQAEQSLSQVRSQYDQMAAYQAEIQRIYGATTVRRT